MSIETNQIAAPATGLTEIDGKAATSVSWSRAVDGEKVSYTLIFRSGTKQLARLKDLTADQVGAALGDTNARSTHYSTESKGLLKGKQLHYAQGISPQLAAQYKDSPENAAAQVYSTTPQAEPVAEETNVDFRDDTQNERAKEIIARQSGNDLREDAGEETSRASEVDQPAPGMTRLYHGSATPGRFDGDAWYSTDRAYAENYRPGAELQYVDMPTEWVNSQLDPDGYGQTVDKGHTLNIELGDDVAGMRQPVLQPSGSKESAGHTGVDQDEEAQNVVDKDDAEHAGEPAVDEELEAREASRKALQEELDAAFYHVDNKYYRRDNDNKLAILEAGSKLRTADSDPYVAVSMVKLAESKGWDSIKVAGTPEFRRAVWMEAALRGIQVRGYKPTEVDLLKLAEKHDARLSNSVEQLEQKDHASTQRSGKATFSREAMHSPNEPSQEKPSPEENARKGTVGLVLSHGAAKFNFDKDESLNYYVRLQTDAGEKVVWGIDLERAMAKGEVQNGQRAELVYLGRQPTQVLANKRDETGAVVGKEWITSHRNAWSATRIEADREDAAVKPQAVAVPDKAAGQAVDGQKSSAPGIPQPIVPPSAASDVALPDKDSPQRAAQAFRSNQQPETWSTAAKQHPQLTAAYAQLSVLKRYAQDSLPEAQREAFVSRQVHNIAKELEAGRPLSAIQIATQMEKKSQQKEASAER